MPKRVLIAITCLFLVCLLVLFIYRLTHEHGMILTQNTAETTVPFESEPFYINGKVNINIANADQLQILDGIGPELAKRIIAFRNQNGPFQSIEDIQNVKGIGETKYNAIAKYITTGG